METRFNMSKTQPEAYKAMFALEKYMSTTAIGPIQKELIKIRASQINGCAYCLNQHNRDARKLGETEQRLYVLSAWREAKSLFSEEEQIMLAMTEEITLIHKAGLSDESYDNAIRIFGEEKTAQILMGIITINAWNRIGVGLRMEPEA